MGVDLAQRKFGSDATELKLDIVQDYLKAYDKVMTGAKARWPELETLYIDAFAGSGGRPVASRPHTSSDQTLWHQDIDDTEELEEFKIGSAIRALNHDLRFNRYIFIEAKRRKLTELEGRLKEHPSAGSCQFIHGDANEKLIELCNKIDWRSRRAVVFLDPFGNSVAWKTVEAIARTKSIDLWYLFPSGNGVFRQISNDGLVTPESANSLDRLFGTPEWRKQFLKEEDVSELFGKSVQVKKVVTPASATEFMISRMKSVFDGGVLDETLPLGDKKHGYPLYSLIFAWGNDSERAGAIATRIAKALVKRQEAQSGWLF